MSTDADRDLFASPAVLRAAFEQGLVDMLALDSLGAFILVLANASFEPATLDRLRDALAARFEEWCQRFECDDPRGTAAAPDDVAVFGRLQNLGLDSVVATRWRRVGPWELQFNPLRALRPARASGRAVAQLAQPFDPDGFHFNRPFLRDEILWEGELANAPLRLLYNKFPFAELHGLLVPHPRRCLPQRLDYDHHALVWTLADRLGGRLPGVGFGYNALGAFASVNHLHLQLFVRTATQYPVEMPHWRHNGGAQAYPLAVERYTDRQAAWQAIAARHVAETGYNLLYRPGCMYLVPRATQGHYVHSAWTAGFAWSEAAGSLVVSDQRMFEELTEDAVEAEFQRLALRP